MPEISRFYGIIVKMFFDDHNPPHFHAIYSQFEAIIEINTLRMQAGCHLERLALCRISLINRDIPLDYFFRDSGFSDYPFIWKG